MAAVTNILTSDQLASREEMDVRTLIPDVQGTRRVISIICKIIEMVVTDSALSQLEASIPNDMVFVFPGHEH